ncbi:hypothetical protein I2W78_08655 [Streptomyces spinoverrucosus]|uniref:hypothetical protein n=1 Tax=Streptomyces spinoverrucosus TaxID=284043 RepID=UPI0018C3CA8F|nr:hypothetical protein [Streptomyces spinoverrucosus]MBG0851909.1 hypothetical protein [Streptomyces spinoverrucosus]
MDPSPPLFTLDPFAADARAEATGTPFQLAVARMLGDEEAWTSWTAELRSTLQRHRGTSSRRTSGEPAIRTGRGSAGTFPRAGVAAIPCSAFRHSPHSPHSPRTDRLVRFSFCTPADAVREAASRLAGTWQA